MKSTFIYLFRLVIAVMAFWAVISFGYLNGNSNENKDGVTSEVGKFDTLVLEYNIEEIVVKPNDKP